LFNNLLVIAAQSPGYRRSTTPMALKPTETRWSPPTSTS